MQAHKKIKGRLRPPSEKEKMAISETLKQCGASLPQSYSLLVHEIKYKEVYVFHERAVLEVAKHISARRNVYFAGLFAGSFRREKFKLGLELAEHLYRLGLLKNYMVVDEERERRFLYGRDVEFKGVRKLAGKLVVVVNKHGDVVGLAHYDGKLLVNLVDKGWYLRKGH